MFGVVPALKASGIGGQALVFRSGRGSTRAASSLRRGLMIAEIAVATVLLSGSGLMVHTMLRLARVDPGFDPHNLQTFMFSLSGPAWPDARKQVFYDTVVERLRAVPGVENAAITYSLPILGSNWWNMFMIAGTTHAQWVASRRVSECGHGAGDRRLLRDAPDTARQRTVLRSIGHARLAARCHHQQQSRQEALAG